MADIKYLVTVDAAGAIKTMKEFDDTLDKTAKSSDKAESSHKGLWKQVAIGTLAYNAAVKAGRFMVDFLKDTITASMEAEKADKALAAALEITGRPVERLASHFKNFANQLQEATTYGDEEIKNAQTLLIQLTDLDRNGLDKATKGAIGLASVMGMDLNSSAQLVAKAMSGNAAALTRYGIQVDTTASKEEQRAQIMAKLNEFYGRATAETETYGGRLLQLKNAYGEVQEAVGRLVVENGFLQSVLSELKGVIMDILTLDNKMTEAIYREADTTQNSIIRFREMAAAVGMTGDQIRELSRKYKDVDDAGIKHERMLRELIKLYPQATDLLHKKKDAHDKEQAEISKAEKGTNKFTNAVKKAEKAEDKFTKEIIATIPQARMLRAELMNIVPPLDGVGAGFDKVTGKISLWDKLSTDSVLHWSEETINNFNAALSATMQFTDGVGGLFQALADRKKSILDKEYEQQKYAIEQSNLSEEEKFIRLSQLEEDYNAKADSIRIAAGKKQKKIQYAMTVMDVAGAIVNALNTHPFIPAGLIAAASATVMGGIQLATIASTPLAKGAIFKQPTLLGGSDGGSYQVAEPGSGGVEIVATPENIRKAIGLDRQRGGGGGTIVIQNRIFLDGKEMKAWMAKVIEETSRIGKLKVAGKAIVGSA